MGEDFQLPAFMRDSTKLESLPSARTTRFRNHFYPNGTRSQLLLSFAEPLAPSQVHPLSPQALVHLCPVASEVDLSAWTLALAPQRACLGIRTSLGVQGFLRRTASRKLPAAFVVSNEPFPLAVLSHFDYAFASDEDLAQNVSLGRELAQRVGVFVLTHGDRGAEVFRGSEVAHLRVPAFTTTAADPAGAGDSFAGAFLAALSQGKDLRAAAAWASAVASLAVEQPGVPRAHAADVLDRRFEWVLANSS
jgi:hypothetical protein